MGTLDDELREFTYRERPTRFSEIFPDLNLHTTAKLVRPHFSTDRHRTILGAALGLWSGGYESIIREQGFYDFHYQQFSGHCHQVTPVLGLALKTLGFPRVSYLECLRIRDHFLETGIIEMVSPDEEPDPSVRDEFCDLGRIPYCCLEVFVDGEPLYVTGKHVKPKDGGGVALLTPVCYRPLVGPFAHQDDPKRSGIYLQPVVPPKNPERRDFSRQVVWMKQTARDPKPEFFATFLRMPLH